MATHARTEKRRRICCVRTAGRIGFHGISPLPCSVRGPAPCSHVTPAGAFALLCLAGERAARDGSMGERPAANTAGCLVWDEARGDAP